MKLFVLLSRVPFPLEKGDKLRAFNQIRYLSRFHSIHLCCLNDVDLHPETMAVLGLYCESIHIIPLSRINTFTGLTRALLSGIPFQAGYFLNYRIKRRIHKLIGEIKPDHIFCQLIRVAGYLENIPVAKTLDFQDAFSINASQRSTTAGPLMKWFLKSEARRVSRYEAKVSQWFNHSLVISEPDREAICVPGRQNIAVVPNGVDTVFFSPFCIPKKYHLLFTGNMAYPPNINSVEFLVHEILPLVMQKKPDIRLLIAGASPDRKVLQLAGENVTVSGWVDDIRRCYAQSEIFVAPMQIGTGLQNKLLEAMAMKLPCITSPLANSSLNAAEDNEVLIGHSPADYAAKILRLLTDEELSRTLAGNGHRFVLKNFNWDAQTEKLNRLMFPEPGTSRTFQS